VDQDTKDAIEIVHQRIQRYSDDYHQTKERLGEKLDGIRDAIHDLDKFSGTSELLIAALRKEHDECKKNKEQWERDHNREWEKIKLDINTSVTFATDMKEKMPSIDDAVTFGKEFKALKKWVWSSLGLGVTSVILWLVKLAFFSG